MKNHRAKLVMAGIALALVVVLAFVIHWYRSGAMPEPPTSFFDTREVQRAIARLESHRLDQQDRLQRCRAVTNHIAQAQHISFTNPDRTDDFLAALQSDLAALKNKLPEEAPWANAFNTFAETARTAYKDADELNQILRQTDWSAFSVPVLERRIVRAKELAASLQAYPTWRSNEELRTVLYPAFEQAYRHRSEQNANVLKGYLLAPGPALTRWYYARLFEDRSGLPQPLCSAALEAAQMSLMQLRIDLAGTDAHGFFKNWGFQTERAKHMVALTGTVQALEQAGTLQDWLAAAELQSHALHHLIQQTRPGAQHPDPRVRVAVDQLQALIQDVRRAAQTFESIPSLDSLDLLVRGLKKLPDSQPQFAECILKPLQGARQTGQTTLRTARGWSAQETPATSELALLKHEAEAFSAELGQDVTESILADAFDQWCDQQWPPVAELGKVSSLIRQLDDTAILHRPALSGAAELLENIAASGTAEQRTRIVPDWEDRVRPRLTDYPTLTLRIDHSLGIPGRKTELDERRDLLASLDAARNSFQKMSRVVNDAPEEDRQALRSGMDRLRSVVERDRQAVAAHGSLEQLSEIASDYSSLSSDDTLPAALAAYARAQARCLISYTLPADYAFGWQLKSGKKFTLGYAQLGEDIEPLGYGRRLKGRGDDLQVWIRTGGTVVPILRGDWKDDPDTGRIRVSDLEAIPGTMIWQWGTPIEVGIRVAHTTNPDKDLVPDEKSARSRWNPLNYGVYRVQTNEYTVATYASLEQLVREQMTSTNEPPHILFDDVFDAEARESATLRFTVEGIPPGRDFDWPKTFAPQTTDDMHRLRTNIESSMSNLVEDLLLTP